MNEQADAQKTWDEYYARIRKRRVSEAKQLISALRTSSVTNETDLFLDFRHFSSGETEAGNLGIQLEDNYDIRITKAAREGYWNIDATIRPDTIALTDSQIIEWTEFMCDVSQSHGCVFSTWSLTNVATEQSWSNEQFETDAE